MGACICLQYAVSLHAEDTCMAQYTIRGVSDTLDGALRAYAQRRGVSLNEATLDVLRRGLGVALEKPVYHDMDDLVGTWVDDPAFDLIPQLPRYMAS